MGDVVRVKWNYRLCKKNLIEGVKEISVKGFERKFFVAFSFTWKEETEAL